MNTRVHVGFVIEAEIDHVVAALESAGQGLHTDVGCRAVTAVTDDGNIGLVDYTLPVHRFISRFDTACHGRGILEGHMYPRCPPRGLRERRGDDFHTSGSAAYDSIGSDCFHCLPQSQYLSAALARAVTG